MTQAYSATAAQYRPIRLAIAGCGFAAETIHAPRLAALPELYEVVAVADPVAARRRALASQLPSVAVHDQTPTMLAQAQPDALAVLTATHYEPALEGLDAGCDLFIEKPMCERPADARALVAAAERRRAVVQVGTMRRFDRGVSLARSWLPEVGPLRWIEIHDCAGAGLSSRRLSELAEPVLQNRLTEFGQKAPRARNTLQTLLLEFVHLTAVVRELLNAPLDCKYARAAEDGWTITGELAVGDKAVPCLFAVAEYGLVKSTIYRSQITITGASGQLSLAFTDAQARPPASAVTLHTDRYSETRIENDAYTLAWSAFYKAVRTRQSAGGGVSDGAADVELAWNIAERACVLV